MNPPRSLSRPYVAAMLLGFLLSPLLLPSPGGAATLSPWEFTTSLQVPRFSPGMAATNTHVYVLGGGTGTNCTILGSVEFAPIQANGSLGPWATTTALSFPRGYLGAAIVGKYVYVVGGANWCGLIEATKYATVERAEILADGSLGPWSAVAPLTHGRAMMPVVTDGTHLYAVGGFDGTNTNTVEMATVQPDGSLSSWQSVSAMTQGRAGAAVAVLNGRLYAAGGLGAGIQASSESAAILPDGTLGAWQPMAAMSVRRYQAAGAGVGGSFWVTGGTPNGVVLNSTEEAVLDQTGTITNWLPGAPMQTPRDAHAAVVSGPVIYVAGGVSNAGGLPAVEASVEFASVPVPDADQDGIPDAAEPCFCLNTPPGAAVNQFGCAVNQVCPCQAPLGRTAWRNHGEYVTCIGNAAREFVDQGLITDRDASRMIQEAAQALCGR